MSEQVNVLARVVRWRRTGARTFAFAARVDGTWWVLRLNDFPHHPLYTLFVDRHVVGDVEDVSSRAPAWDLDAAERPSLTDEQRDEVLALTRGLEPYGSEVGRPCEGDWCSCAGDRM
ncbi:hypothetical protein ADK67_30940 [Saccharothrix sp. NRRL B-16348]|uniref:hypothetical protein n=1 Tax=Saccharothrix sp. NRRL B-16348 TaxID=1415542 RepID=UPI0006C45968|nr:hypothetical protein [Saccharothrix sp. NRRL B-16348]KOX20000.1 hypothetical protein ADK67_30940 [Saccharothrix sp. NRRL B-16348]